ncbi:STAS domain-containing protein [Pedobacter arcticus]|uniref:STAS domain-containing protein n=1 Tax=Pedobacter arcticus TaxID=752140 RepID=UPI000309AE1B|nr:STAS domain-containing protein [Pedobacter arcticus]
MDYSKSIINNVVLININLSEASLNQSEDFKKFLYDTTEVTPPKLVLDMSEIQYMDSSFIGALVAGLKNVLSKGGEMALVNVNTDVMALFELTRLDKVFKIYDTKEEAIEELK